MQQSNRFRLICLCSLALAVFSESTFAQTSAGALVGLVRDSAGAAIPQAAVTVTNTQTNVVSRLATDHPGDFEYRLSDPSHGVYAFVIDGEANCAGVSLARRDSVGVSGSHAIRIATGKQPTDVLLVETAP